MKTTQLSALTNKKRRQAMALILVIITVALMSILIIAMFSVTRTEYTATQNFVAARSAKQYADFAVAITQGQLQNAQNTTTTASSRTIHATQPGMVRVYRANGDFKTAYKLYSSSKMVINSANEADIFKSEHQVPQDWKTGQNRARFVDLNEPVVRPGLTAGTRSVYFPIIDPRAAYTGNNPSTGQPMTAIEGFSYSKATPAVTGGGGSVTYNDVVLPSEAGTDISKLRLPMPVEWLYVLQDGTMGALNSSNKFITAEAGKQPTATNPIVARVAFWTDDESCKVNVNTAAEPTFMAPPYFYHQRDYQWANFPASSGEYQRYPGHPATVALSAIIAPGVKLDPLAPNANVSNIVTTKEYIYNLMPKIPVGGSKAGTLPFMKDDFSSTNNEENPATIADSTAARSERLFASVDEMLFKDTGFDTNGRVAARYEFPGGDGRPMFDRDTLERARFFLTAHSRAPEFSNHGLPRVAMWPVSDETLGDSRRTSFDNLIALCATLRGSTTGAAIANSYIFRRAQPHHATHDVTGSSSSYGSSQGLARNSKLLDFLYSQMTGLEYPQISSLGSSPNFSTKYGNQNAAQLAIQFFDYIRCTNLYDGVLARENDGMDGTSPTGTALYTLNDNKEGSAFTYTNHRVTRKASGSLKDGTQNKLGNDILSDDSKVFPGHGQVTPAVWSKAGTSVRGFGRMFTLSEVGFQFICTADGKNDQYAVNFNGQLSGGGSAPRADPTVDSVNPVYTASTFTDSNPANDGKGRWYSNFPPLLPQPGGSADPPMLYGVLPSPANGTSHPSKHPGYDPNNWNMSLANATPLLPDEKRVQAMLLLETFCPMLGWTKFYPEYSIVLDGNFISGIKLNGQPLYDTTQDVVIKSNGNLYEANDVYSLGGHAGPTAMAGSRGARPVSGTGRVLMPSDPSFVTGNTSGHNALTNYGVNSNFITIKRNQPMNLTFGQKEFVIRLYDRHRYQELGLQPVQIIRIAFDDSPLPVPALVYSQQRLNGGSKADNFAKELNYYKVTDQYGRIIYWRSLQGPHWWCLNSEGCIGRLKGAVNPAYSGGSNPPFWLQTPTPYAPGDDVTPLRQTLRGRLDTAAARVDGPPGAAQGLSIIPYEAPASVAATTDEDTGQPWSGSDVIRTMVPAVGDYRLLMGRYDVPKEMWMRHPMWTAEITKGMAAAKTVHTFTTHWGTTENGVDLPPSGSTQQLVAQAPYTDARQPDLPPDAGGGWGAVANSFGDFDNGIGNSRDGAYVNKPDEGNFYAGNFTRNNITKYYRSGYFWEPWHNSDDWRSGVYMTPNRMVTSPVMFGSLPTGVWPGGSVSTSALAGASGISYSAAAGKPWQTLLFRPYARSHSTLGKAVNPGHPGDNNPRDHFLLDMFFMPVVEPYAISEPLSVAGRINLNYQIVPFTNITRATGLHALMKGEFITAIPRNADVNNAKTFQSSPSNANQWDKYWNEQTDRKFWHRPINVAETLVQFDEKFTHTATGANHNASRFRGLFRSASQICEIHLIPDVSQGLSAGGEVLPSPTMKGFNAGNRQSAMDLFWQNHSPTGDNTRERPYSNIYSRVTTRSNTFRVHMRAQIVRKARSVAVDTFDPDKDAVVGEYRGSALVERYIDPTDTTKPIPDYAAASNPLSLPPLDTFYKFRTLEYKRFSP